ncbi:hypothetical protein E5288_WYG013013 [Bos mutus]|uniref:Uncharacterized protein n=1 Tax=Bos mutus TaxID=72004 RepID=A0A6B0R941_9CETA|nr:hypothetical protein [Bos mutus]
MLSDPDLDPGLPGSTGQCHDIVVLEAAREENQSHDDVSIRLAKRQKTLMIDSEMETENENHEAGKRYFASAEEWIEDNIS